MTSFVAFFLFSSVVVFNSPILPGAVILIITFAGSVVAGIRQHWWLAGLLSGLLWSSIHGHAIIKHALPDQLQGIDLQIIGRISDLPVRNGRVTRFVFDMERVLSPEYDTIALKTLRLSWYNLETPLNPGEYWRLTVRLKQNHGLLNPGGFDYERWLISKGINASGYVRQQDSNRKIADARFNVHQRLRTYLLMQIATSDLSLDTKALVKALAVGYGQALSSEQWEWFRLTGTSHLLVISGLHISLAAGASWLFAGFLYGFLRLLMPDFLDKDGFCAVVTLGVAGAYASLAGFTVPTLRALIMLTTYLAFRVSRRHLVPSRPFYLAVFLVLILQPLSPMTSGFWLSFTTIALIYYLGVRIRFVKQRFQKWLLWHALLTLAMLPMIVGFFDYLSPLAFIANLFAVPYVSLLIVPLVLLGVALLMLFEPAGLWLLQWLDWPINLLLDFLQFLAGIDDLQFYPASHDVWAWLLLSLSVLVLLLPRGMGLNWLAVPLASAFVLPVQRDGLNEGQFQISAIDVGQGLSVLVETKNHTLLFDTGGQFSGNRTMADIAVIPYLRNRGIHQLDKLVISHTDTDHAAGINALQDAGLVMSVAGPKKFAEELQADEVCGQDREWFWDSVRFSYLNDKHQSYRTKNDFSCVLRIESGLASALIPGDIEQPAELNLLEGGLKPVDLLVAPHHGSKSSSSESFLQALSPKYVVYAVGYRNRFKFPHPSVTERYRKIGAQDFRSDRDGLIQFLFGPEGLVQNPYRYRQTKTEFWRSGK